MIPATPEPGELHRTYRSVQLRATRIICYDFSYYAQHHKTCEETATTDRPRKNDTQKVIFIISGLVDIMPTESTLTTHYNRLIREQPINVN